MATAAVTPPKAPPNLQSAVVGALLSRTGLGSILPGVSWIGASTALWNVYAQASGARPASAARINAPSSAPAPQPHGHDGAGTQGKTERNIRFQLDNAPPGTRVSTRVGGTAFHIETGKAAQTGSAAARPKASLFDGPAIAAGATALHAGDKHPGAKPVFAAKEVHTAATGSSVLSKALVVAELIGDTISPVSFLARHFTPLQLIHGALGAASFIPEVGSLAALADGAIYGVQALYAQSKGDDKAAKEYAASAALDVLAAGVGALDGDAGATKLGLQGARALASRGFALAGNTGGHIVMAGAGARGVLTAGKVRGAIVAGVDVLNNGKPQVSQSVGNSDGGGSSPSKPSASTPSQRTPPKPIEGELLKRKEGGELTGPPERMNPKDDQRKIDLARRQEEGAEIMRDHGFKVERVSSRSAKDLSADWRVDGEKMEVYAPTGERDARKIRNIVSNIYEKVQDQATNIVVNLDGTKVTGEDIMMGLQNKQAEKIELGLQDKKIENLYTIDHDKNVTLYRFPKDTGSN